MTLWPNGTKVKPYVTSSFGPRNLPNPNASKYHRGTDVVGFREVKAIDAGQIRVIGTPSGWLGGGTQVWIQHDGYFSRYLHLASYSVKNNQFVREGETIGIMGTTPKVDLHLHFEVSPGRLHYSNTGQIDPVTFIESRISGSSSGGTATPIKPPTIVEENPMEFMMTTEAAAGQGDKQGIRRWLINSWEKQRREISSEEEAMYKAVGMKSQFNLQPLAYAEIYTLVVK